ncbi:MAG: hypothetical protein GY854_01400 [Deltaproteobacteria bacterium]|nr:hypothetical protein [Deltaproteobacteria bacterium]
MTDDYEFHLQATRRICGTLEFEQALVSLAGVVHGVHCPSTKEATIPVGPKT